MTNTSINDRVYTSYVETSRGSELSHAQAVTFGDSAFLDAFCRARMSTPTIIFDNAEIQGKKTLVWSENLVGAATATHIANQSATALATSAASGDKATRSSKKLALYTPGTSLMVLLTGVMGVGATNSRQRIGMFNAQNGIFFEQKDGAMGVVIRSFTSGSAVDNRVEQANWNIDKCDGTGVSGCDLDFTKTQIFFIDLEWLGVGRVRCGFVHDGKIVLAHEFYHNNRLSTVYMTSPMLPVTYEVENVGASAARSDFRQICSAIIIEGDQTVSHQARTINNGIVSRALTATTALPVISMKLQTSYVGKAMLKPTDIDVLVTASKDCLFEVIYNGTLESASWANASSGIGMLDVAATHVTGGVKLGSVYTASDNTIANNIFDHILWLGGEITGTADTLTITGRLLSGGAGGNGAVAINYEEFV